MLWCSTNTSCEQAVLQRNEKIHPVKCIDDKMNASVNKSINSRFWLNYILIKKYFLDFLLYIFKTNFSDNIRQFIWIYNLTWIDYYYLFSNNLCIISTIYLFYGLNGFANEAFVYDNSESLDMYFILSFLFVILNYSIIKIYFNENYSCTLLMLLLLQLRFS